MAYLVEIIGGITRFEVTDSLIKALHIQTEWQNQGYRVYITTLK